MISLYIIANEETEASSWLASGAHKFLKLH